MVEPDGEWRRGGGWVRPFAAVVLLLMRRRMEVKFREMVAEMSGDWNADVPELLAHDPREAGFWMPALSRDRAEYARWIEETR
ncbi:hypothetical protein OUY22_25960 [Nonomuraea sp. MCN248]|uniref:Uncharacterized protein n=1 Tax=Nonomuraea corallina TaxID=2989783 RepID=A0ABT4SI36_9ACTN|nr:hypothetical protein [Nonomuraea corallina]MDA0636869.1 hypothetical protein [Nonomuraea corallina]